MAITLAQSKVSANLQNTVASAIATVKKVRGTESARKEAEFQKAVASGMSYADQLKFREKQLSDEKTSDFSDPDFITSLETSIGTTKKLSRFEKIRTKYQDSLDAYVQGKSSLSESVNLLNNLYSEEQDPEMKTKLREEISKLVTKQTENEINGVQNRALLAQRDLSIPLIQSSIDEVKSKRTAASINDNQEEVSIWDETLNALNTTKSKLTVQNKKNEITYAINKNNLKTHQQVGLIDSMVNGADATAPFIFDGNTYTSEKEYWERQRDQVVSSPDFWSSLSNDIDEETSRIASSSPAGQIPLNRVQEVSDFYNNLKTQPAFAMFADKIEQQRVSRVDEYVNEQAEFVRAEAIATGDYSKADRVFADVERRFGIKLSDPERAAGTPTSLTTTLGADLKKPVATPAATPAPAATLPTVPTTPKGEYQAIGGDSLSKIAASNNVPLSTLLDLNPQYKSNPNMLRIGETIKLPGAVGTPTSLVTPPGATPAPTTAPKAPTVVPPATPTVTPPTIPTATSKRTIKVGQGETLSQIAQRELGDAKRWRELTTSGGQGFDENTAKTIKVGTELSIPM